MDDKSPNTSAPQSNIDDLVKELSRPQNPSAGSASPSAPTNQTVQPVTPPLTSAPPRPVNPAPMAQNSTPVPPTTSPAPTPKEYQSSIRTMSDDLSRIKAGQQPQGVDIPRKIDNTPAGPVRPSVPAPAPAPVKQMATATLPSATKSAPMAPIAPAPKAPAPTPIPRPVMPTMPAPNKASDIKPDSKNQFYVPPVESKPAKSSSKGIIFAGIALAIVLLGGLYWYFMIGGSGSDPVATESPVITFTPRPTATPNPDVLSTIFKNKGGTIVLPAAGDPTTALISAIGAQSGISQGTLTTIDIASGASVSAQTLTVAGVLNRFIIPYPPALQTALGQNYKFLLYGQKESFDSKGKPAVNVAAGSRLVIINEIASSSANILQEWEPTMSTGLAGIMGISASKNTKPFESTTYKGVAIRFKNFAYPDRSIDYALVKYNDKTYLVITGSRESMFATIDAFSVLGK